MVNAYAMKFEVMVPANVTDLKFSWQSLVKHPVRFRNNFFFKFSSENDRFQKNTSLFVELD